jgi:hypothetical protein
MEMKFFLAEKPVFDCVLRDRRFPCLVRGPVDRDVSESFSGLELSVSSSTRVSTEILFSSQAPIKSCLELLIIFLLVFESYARLRAVPMESVGWKHEMRGRQMVIIKKVRAYLL